MLQDNCMLNNVTLDSQLTNKYTILEVIDVVFIDQVNAINEELCSPHCIEKVSRRFYLSEKLDEELRFSVDKHAE